MTVQRRAALALLALALAPASPARADDAVKEAQETITVFRKVDPGTSRFFTSSAGYAVFPTVGKGAIGIGGAGGSGVLFEGGEAIGKATLAQVTFGLQLGGQAYSEVIFFESAAALTDFKNGTFALAAQVSAVAAAAGASANAKYERGVAVFTLTKAGLMYEASVGGQKFGYEPFAKKK
ncbi:MAG TPA: YSC84-related protein [Anaeromyxobacter sp.]|nr:YSC84-related protein [Anaeromyxobacter sp.]